MSGVIRIHRVGGRYRDAARSYKVLVDGNVAGRVKAGHDLAVSAEAGRHVVRLKVDYCRSRDVEVNVPDGGGVDLECRPNAGAWRVLWDTTIGAMRYITLEPRS